MDQYRLFRRCEFLLPQQKNQSRRISGNLFQSCDLESPRRNGTKDEEFVLNKNKKDLNLMLHGSHGGNLHSVSCNYIYDAKTFIHNQPLPPKFIDGEKHRFYILGSCDGLLLVVATTGGVGDHDVIYIWNPKTGEYKILPQLKSYMPMGMVLGFGRDLTTDDNNYKVLFFESVHVDSGSTELKVNMYTTHTNSWKTLLPNIPFMYSSVHPTRMVLAYANLHHVIQVDISTEDTTEDDPYLEERLISFDLKDDNLRVRTMPGYPGSLVNLCTLKDDLCAFIDVADVNLYSLWRMENFGVKDQECWVKMFSIDSSGVMDKPIDFLSSLHLLDDHQILLTAQSSYPPHGDPFVVCYNTENRKTSLLIQAEMPFWSIPVVYEESFISPNSASNSTSTGEEELSRKLKLTRNYMEGSTQKALPRATF